MKKVFQYIAAKYFFPDYAPEVKNYTHKMRGLDGNGKEIEFTAEDKKAVKAGIKKMAKELVVMVK